MAKVLIIEDDLALAATLREWFESQGHRPETTATGEDGLHLLQYNGFDLALVDWQLPGHTGIEICQAYRKTGGRTPILMLTQKDKIADKVTGLDAGADDFLPKPFAMEELAARVRALLRRSSAFFSDELAVGRIALDYGRCQITVNGRSVQLVPREFDVLEFLLRNPQTFISTEKLIAHVWEADSSVTSEALRVCINRIRKKIDCQGEPSLIESSKGLGYKIADCYLSPQ